MRGWFDAPAISRLQVENVRTVLCGAAPVYVDDVKRALGVLGPRFWNGIRAKSRRCCISDAAVTEVAVVGRPDHEWGERVVAFMVAGAGVTPTPETLDRLCLANIARFKRPKQYVFVPKLPKNHYGKVLETELRARLSAT